MEISNISDDYNDSIFITHAPLFRGGVDLVNESPLGDSCFGYEYS